MKGNLERTRGLVFSGTLLITLTDKGITREDAYRLVQKHALATWDGGGTFQERCREDSEITEHLGAQELDQVFDLQRHFQYVDLIFERATS